MGDIKKEIKVSTQPEKARRNFGHISVETQFANTGTQLPASKVDETIDVLKDAAIKKFGPDVDCIMNLQTHKFLFGNTHSIIAEGFAIQLMDETENSLEADEIEKIILDEEPQRKGKNLGLIKAERTYRGEGLTHPKSLDEEVITSLKSKAFKLGANRITSFKLNTVVNNEVHTIFAEGYACQIES